MDVDVLIAGAGPCGLMLAIELGRRGVRCLLVDPKAGTAFNPQANATQARTMEHFRRLGFVQEVREHGLPMDHPTDIAYFTRFTGHELARLALPTARQATESIKSLGGSWSAAELPHRVSQKFVEATLLKHALALESVDLRFLHTLTAFEDQGDHVTAVVRSDSDGRALPVRAQYLVGADGARSMVRRELGFGWEGATGIKRDFMGGKMFAVYLRAPAFYERVAHDRAWMYVSVNAQRRVFMVAVDGQGEFAFHAAIHEGEDGDQWTAADAQRIFDEAMGMHLPIEVLSVCTWTAGHALYASGFQKGRVFIGGDAAHLFTPTGGLGYNTAVEDAVNLAWKLASVIQKQAPETLLESYERERQPVARRNTQYARQFADSVGLFKATGALEQEGADGDAAREEASKHLNAHVRMEFNIPGVTFGGRYDGSPIIASDGTSPPPDAANTYTPTACPGGRPPHAWLGDGESLYDRFGSDWTLLCLQASPQAGSAFEAQARALGIRLKVVRLESSALRALYEAPLTLIRPDQIVAWRGQEGEDAGRILEKVLGGRRSGDDA
jgi:2-polyprenyl-6-methoxyphenol hydroxylase-like FAD-dependent oxidoreductase